MSFDLFADAAGTTHPKGDVTITLDGDTAYQARVIDDKLNTAHKADLSDAQVKKLEAELRKLKKKLKDELITIHMQGIPSPERERINKKIEAEFGSKDSENKNRKFDAYLFHAHYQGASKGGVKDESKWTEEQAEQFLQMIPVEAYARIINKIVDLSMRSDNYERVETSADFS